MLDICPNCNIAVVNHSRDCKDHRSAESMKILSTPPSMQVARGKEGPPADRPSLEQLLLIIAEVFEVSPIELQKKRKGNNRPYPVARQLFSFIAHVDYKYKMREIGEFLGISSSAISNKLATIRHALTANKKNKAYYEKIKERLLHRELA